MRFAYHASMCDPDFYLPLAIACEEAGFDTFTFPDSICYPEVSDSKYPYNGTGDREFLKGVPFLEPFVIVPAMAAATQTATIPPKARRGASGGRSIALLSPMVG